VFACTPVLFATHDLTHGALAMPDYLSASKGFSPSLNGLFSARIVAAADAAP